MRTGRMTPETEVPPFRVGDRVRVLRVDGARSVTARCPFEAPILAFDGGYFLVQERGVGTWRVTDEDIEAIAPPSREDDLKRQLLSLFRSDSAARVRLTDWLEGICAHCQNEDVVMELGDGEEGQFCASCIESMVAEVKADRKFEESRA